MTENASPSTLEDNGFVRGYFEPIELKAPNEACELTLQGAQKNLYIKAAMTQLPHILSLVERYL
jgi:hypothetical protein